MENERKKRKFGEEEKSSQNDLAMKEHFIDSIKEKTDDVYLEVQDLLSDCCLEVCKTESSLNDMTMDCSMQETEENFIDSMKQKTDNDDFKIVDYNSVSDYYLNLFNTSEDKEQYVSSTNIDRLPKEMLERIFEYVDCYLDYRRCKRVCRRWYDVATSEEKKLFGKITINIKPTKVGVCGVCRRWCDVATNEKKKLSGMITIEIKPTNVEPVNFGWTSPESFICRLKTVLTTNITHLNINFEISLLQKVSSLNFCMFSKELRKYCPNLYMLVLRGAKFDVCGVNLDIAITMPKNIRVLVLQKCEFIRATRLKDIDCDIPKIKVLDLSHCKNLHVRPTSFLLLRNLKKLRLSGCRTKFGDFVIYPFEPVDIDCELPPKIGLEDYYFASVIKLVYNQLKTLDLEFTLIHYKTFHTIYTRCISLTELFICFTSIKDEHLTFDEPQTVLPNLKTLCLRNCQVTVKGVSAFLEACPSLNNVYVGSKDENPADGFSQCDLPKVSVLNGYKHCYHYQQVDYMA